MGHGLSETTPAMAGRTAGRTSRFHKFFSAYGKVPRSWEKQGNFKNQLVFDAPFHIINLGELNESLLKTCITSDLSTKLAEYLKCWLRELKHADKRASHAIPRYADGGVDAFRLADHAWVWRALRCIEKLQSHLEPHLADLGKDYSSEVFQRDILTRFITESPYPNQPGSQKDFKPEKQMLSVGRSSLMNRFLFHTKDTALFYAIDSDPGFLSVLQSTEMIDVWHATLQSQQDYEENSDTSWTRTLRYALAIIMAQKGYQINHRPTADMFRTAMDILLQSTSPNGLFPILLDGNNDPLHDMGQLNRDTNLLAMFEIPFVLYNYVRHGVTNEKSPETIGYSKSRRDESATPSYAPFQREIGNSMRKANLKKTSPFNNFVDQTSIVEIEDEWLYNYPDFLDFTPKKDGEKQYSTNNKHSFVIDIPKSKRTNPLIETVSTMDQAFQSAKNDGVGALFGKTRAAENAKKRFIMLSNIDEETKELSVDTSAPAERKNMESFFNRHVSFKKYFADNTTSALNKWDTELHVSYYSLSSPEIQLQQGSLDARTVPFPGISKPIRQEGLGFRFVGDFFDRYWTCHFVRDSQELFQIGLKLPELLFREHVNSESERRKEPWRQRKVLELLLFEHMLDEIISSTSIIILETRRQVLNKEEAQKLESRESRERDQEEETESSVLSDALSLCKTDSLAYFTVNKRWQIFQQILQIVEDDITENLEVIGEWTKREKERYLKKPRWTRNKERKYRSTISKLLASNERKILRLHRCRANIQSLKASLEKRLQYMRDDLNAYFTTVTVIFLPLSFAVGIYSMSDSPGRKVLLHMIYTSVVALSVTVLVLVNAQLLTTIIAVLWRWGSRLFNRVRLFRANIPFR